MLLKSEYDALQDLSDAYGTTQRPEVLVKEMANERVTDLELQNLEFDVIPYQLGVFKGLKSVDLRERIFVSLEGLEAMVPMSIHINQGSLPGTHVAERKIKAYEERGGSFLTW